VRSRTAWLSRAAITGTEQPVYTRFHTDGRRCSARSDAECFTAPPAGRPSSPTPLDVTVGVDGKCEAVVSELPDEAAAPLHAARSLGRTQSANGGPAGAPAAGGHYSCTSWHCAPMQTLPLQAKLDPGLGANSNFSPRKAVPLPFLVRCPRAVRVVFACGGCVRSAAGAPAGQGPCLVA
jgi:hypothetical protein